MSEPSEAYSRLGRAASFCVVCYYFDRSMRLKEGGINKLGISRKQELGAAIILINQRSFLWHQQLDL